MNQLFYTTRIQDGMAALEEEECRHIVSVMRKKPGDKLWMTDGKGLILETEITETGKKQLFARILHTQQTLPRRQARLHLAIAPTKQIERFEWLLEKATETGIDEITPIFCQRSERDTLRTDRLEKILISAMKQSLQAWLPRLNAPVKCKDFLPAAKASQKYICWCASEPLPPLHLQLNTQSDALILIGPEGDFSETEVAQAHALGFEAVSLGPTRLRTETAGLYAVMAWNMG